MINHIKSLAIAIGRFLADRNLTGSCQPATHLAELNSTELISQEIVQPDFHG